MPKRLALLSLLALALFGPLAAQEIKIDDAIVTRADSLKAAIKLAAPAKGEGQLTLTWTDSYGRTVAVEQSKVAADGDTLPVTLPLGRAVALRNFIEGELKIGDAAIKLPRAEFIVTPDTTPWNDYLVIMYYPYRTPEQQLGLRDFGVTTGRISGNKKADSVKNWWANDYRYYCDQIACDFLATYHNPRLRPKWKLFLDAQAAHKADPASMTPFVRTPCLFDPEARADAMKRMRQAAQTHMRYRPWFYSTDECGVGDLAAAWDFCFDPRTLAAMRTWLLEQYGSLDGINKQWGTKFAKLDDVVPQTSDQAMARDDANYSAWADHRYFMNKAFADAVREAGDSARAADPSAIAGLLGAQGPAAFGGYDYWLLSKAMDMIEPYNVGNNREVWRSLAPRKPAAITSFGPGPMEIWRLWYQALHGDIGVIIYDERGRYMDENGKPTPTAMGMAPLYRELTSGLVKQLWAMKRQTGSVAIHYSQPSITAFWMLEHLPAGKAWAEVHPENDKAESPFLRVRESWARVLEDLDLGYHFVAYGQLENGEFDKSDAKVMILPQSIALSEKECQALRRFVERGGTLIADCRTGLMDQHCRTLGKGQLDDLFGIERTDDKHQPGPAGLTPAGGDAAKSGQLDKISAIESGVRPAKTATALYKDANGTPAVIVNSAGKGKTIYLNLMITDYHRWRMKPPEGDAVRQFVGGQLASAGAAPEFKLASEGGPAYAGEIHAFRGGDLQIVAVHRNYQIRTHELGPPEYQRQDALQAPLTETIDFGGTYAVYDQRAGKYLGKLAKATFDLDKLQPTIFTLLPEPVTALAIDALAQTSAGQMVEAKLQLNGPKLGDTHVFHVQLLGPGGKEIPMLTQSLLAPRGQATWRFPLAASDPKGDYTLQVNDVATGTKATHTLKVN